MNRLFKVFQRSKKDPRWASGFSLMEVIMAVFIVLIALMGVMALLLSVNFSAKVSASKLVAANLAQEGVEVVKSIRDLNFDINGWDDWYNSISGSTDYVAQYNDTALRPFSSAYLKYDSASGLYGYDAGQDTLFNFQRTITLTKVSDNEIKVEVSLAWTDNGRAQNLMVEDRLWNWR